MGRVGIALRRLIHFHRFFSLSHNVTQISGTNKKLIAEIHQYGTKDASFAI
jgi:hypothetical protein